MKIIELLNESIKVHSEGLLAWIITVAESYASKPTMVPQDAFHWQAMIFANQNLLSKALSKIKIIPVPSDPYEIVGQQGGGAENAMIKDIVFNKQLKVFSGGSPHPMMTQKDNIMFRALHDFFAHAGSQAKSLKAFYDQQQLITPQDAAELPPFVLSSHSFTIRGEMNAYLTHTKLAPVDAWPALFSEIIGQASYYFCVGDFPEQKVAVLDGFDFRNLGVCTGPQQARMQELLAIISDPNQPTIPTRVNNTVLDKRKINWKLLSSGTASRQTESISEAGMGQIFQHMKKGPYIIMSAWRQGFNREQNRRRNAELRHHLYREFGLASIAQRGFWPVETDQEGNTVESGREDSLFIPMNQPTSQIKDIATFMGLAKQMMIDYDQDAVMFNDGTTTKQVSNPNRIAYEPPGQQRIGNGINVLGRHQSTKGLPGWSEKGNYKYHIAEK